jgi:hypothetical protein
VSNKSNLEYEEINLNYPIDFMRFTLIYDGSLPAQGDGGSRVSRKQVIRDQIHPQLEELWNTHPALEKTFQRWLEADKKGRVKV